MSGRDGKKVGYTKGRVHKPFMVDQRERERERRRKKRKGNKGTKSKGFKVNELWQEIHTFILKETF